MDDRQQELEARAYFALQGASGAAGKAGDWRIDVAAALRSDAPLSPTFREALASLIVEGRHGFRLELVGEKGKKKRLQDMFGGMLVRREWMEIGQWMADQISAGASRTDAIKDAAIKFPASCEKCDAALVYHTRATRWVAFVRESESDLALLGEETLVHLFHDNDAAGRQLDRKPPSAPEME